jgi:FlaA1/EpsC-like NDP-sugar epimerase
MPSPRNRHILLCDIGLLVGAPFLLYALRFEGAAWGPAHTKTAIVFAVAALPIRIAIAHAFGLYKRLWKYAGVPELERIGAAGVVSGLITFVLGVWLLPGSGIVEQRVPLSLAFSDAVLTTGLLALPRLLTRYYSWRKSIWRVGTLPKRVLIAGAGTAGEMVARELLRNPELGMLPIGFVDDDSHKQGLSLGGFPVLGRLADITKLALRHDVQEVLIAMPRAAGTVVREVVRAAYEAKLPTRTIPALTDILAERVGVTSFREVRIEDLLRRNPVQTTMQDVTEIVSAQTVLITGAGGSIGSELARQIAALDPSALILLGHGENSIFEIHQELERDFPHLVIRPIIADIRDRERMLEIFGSEAPSVVFHAAAHKHVPLMEGNVAEAVSNNVLGTQNVVDASLAADVPRLVLISTDKAVRPSSVMGATKRVAELIVQRAAIMSGRAYVSVRFGNVLGSRGSVVPTFLRQIRDGGPVYVTHPEMRRYFMTIPEAVQLVLQAGALGQGPELFMLDMGEPVSIVDLARDLIRLSSLREGDDIRIEFTGTRPGEKLYEEMFFSHELAEPTCHPKILRARNGIFNEWQGPLIARLIDELPSQARSEPLRALLAKIVPDYVSTSMLDVYSPETDTVTEEDGDERIEARMAVS